MSGTTANRPAFREMLNDAMQRKFDGILFWKLDRFSREGPLATLAYIKQLRDRKVWLRSQTESWFDTGNESIADLIIPIMAWFAREEQRKISQRTKAGIAQRRAIGQWGGGKPKTCLECGYSHKVGYKCKEPKNEAAIARAIKRNAKRITPPTSESLGDASITSVIVQDDAGIKVDEPNSGSMPSPPA
jgi:DNA invertase Pin-like site-specific DNA recombinase